MAVEPLVLRYFHLFAGYTLGLSESYEVLHKLYHSTARKVQKTNDEKKQTQARDLGSISQRVRTSPNLGLVLGDMKNVWLVLHVI